MKITGVKVRKLSDNEKMKAIVSVTFDDEIVIHDIKVIYNEGRLFVAMPSRRTREAKYLDIAHPINGTVREYLETEVLNAYRQASSEMMEQRTPAEEL